MNFKAGQGRPNATSSEAISGVRGDDLGALLRKYDTLAKLRDDRDGGGGVAKRGELRTLAREFPGVLRELDTMSREEIERRRIAIGAALNGAPIEPWMHWSIAYHATMRAALFIKARLSRLAPESPEERRKIAGPAHSTVDHARVHSTSAVVVADEAREDSAPAVISADTAHRLAALASADSGIPIDESFVVAVARPPHRRLNAAVFQKLGAEFGLPAETMWETLFPSRRAGRF